MIDTKALRQKVLDLAIRGKLTEQLPEDGTAEELYQRIQEEKNELVAERKIKKGKSLPAIDEKGIPFDIPQSWKWVRWGDISNQIQYGYIASAQDSGRVKMVRISDIQNNLVNWDSVPYCDIGEDEIALYQLHDKDILFARTGGTVGKSYLVGNIDCLAVFAGYLIRTSYSDRLNAKYIKYFMDSNLYWKQLQDGTTATAQPNCNGQTLSKMLLPLPPASEQVRIVDIIDKALVSLNCIDELQNDYTSNMSVLKARLIDAAIQGKLTEQLPGDGTAEELYQKIQKEKQRLEAEGKIRKEKPLPAVSDVEIPFDIPKSWKWIRLRDLGDFSGGKTPSMANKEYWENGSVIWVTSKDMKRKYIDSSEMMITEKAAAGMTIYSAQTVLFVVRSGILRHTFPVSILKDYGTINQDLKALSLYIPAMSEFVYYVFKGLEDIILFQYTKDGTTVNNIIFDQLLQMPIPLPPLVEQKRIVAKLDELMKVLET